MYAGDTGLMSPISKGHPLRRWLSGLVESSFNVEIGICDPSLADYLVDLLTEFIHMERITMLADGRRIEDLTAMLGEAEWKAEAGASREHRLTLYRHIGDYALFWTGLYPEQLRRLRRRQSRDALLSFFAQGKRSYAIASDLSTDRTAPPASVLRRLSDQFEHCAYGLGLVRKSWEQSDPVGFDAVNRAWLQ